MARRVLISSEVLARYVAWHIRARGYAPTGVEVAAEFGVSPHTARGAFQRAEDAGLLRRGKGLRNVTVLEEAGRGAVPATRFSRPGLASTGPPRGCSGA